MALPRLPSGAIAGPIDQRTRPDNWNGLLFVGEAPGAQEIIQNKPFIGPAGQLFDTILNKAGLDRNECFVTNAFRYQPGWTCNQNGQRRNNNIELFFSSVDHSAGKTSSYRGRYLHKDHWSQIRELNDIITENKPRAIIALGAVAMWALTNHEKITDNRGKVLAWRRDPSISVVPTYHPAYALHKKRPGTGRKNSN